MMGLLRSRTGLTFDLPTEAEWERACRAGTLGPYYTGTLDESVVKERIQGDPKLDPTGTHYIYVGLYLPNAYGLYDMQGNVKEWCLDVYVDRLGTESVVDALRLFFGNYAYDRETDFPRTKGVTIKDQLTWVEVAFDGVSQADVGDEFAAAVSDGALRVRRTFEAVDGKLKSWYCAVDKDGRSVKGTKSLKTLPKGLMLNISYLPSMSNPADDLKMSGTSLLKDLIGDSIRSAFEKSGAVQQLQKKISRLVAGSKNGCGGESDVAKFESKKDRDDVKPYHLLNEYEKGKCKGLDELSRKIEGLFKGLKAA